MKAWREYTFREYLAGRPFIYAFKQLRNDIYVSIYCKRHPAQYQHFIQTLAENNHSAPLEQGHHLVISIAFERPETIQLQLENAKAYITDATLIVIDNSKSPEARKQIQQLCEQFHTPYFALPDNPTRHANRSHAMAMQWCYENIVSDLKPDSFAFIDHDLIPMKPIKISQVLHKQDFYGVAWNNQYNVWQLWAGYCFFDYKKVAHRKLNFLYDFSLKLDTGGRNYHTLYRYYDQSAMHFASNFLVDVFQPSNDREQQLQIIDDTWVHLRGAGHVEGFENRYLHFKQRMQELDSINNWSVTNPEAFAYITPTRS